MFQLSLHAVIGIGSLSLAFITYIASVQYRLGKVETKVDSNEKVINTLQRVMASKSDIDGVNSRLDKIDSSINKLFDIERETRGNNRKT